MKKIGIVSLVLGCLALGFLPRTGTAQASAVTVNVPFAFMVNDTKLAAGTYKIAQVENQSYMISDPKGEQKVMFTTETATMPNPAKSFTLIFNVYGDQYYLSKFFHQGKTSGCAIPQTAAEKELAQKVPVTTKIVTK